MHFSCTEYESIQSYKQAGQTYSENRAIDTILKDILQHTGIQMYQSSSTKPTDWTNHGRDYRALS